MCSSSRPSEDDAVKGTLLSSYTNPLIRDARNRQDKVLVERFRGQALNIADLGCGDGYHGEIFAPAGGVYHGYERAPEIARLAAERWQQANLVNARLILGDLALAEPPSAFYDLVFCLYFTPGNLRDSSRDLSFFTDEYLDHNPVFIGIVSRFVGALKPGGRMFLTIYKDVPEAEAAQFDFYLNTGQHPITPQGSRFVATKEGFWSARWTRRSMLSNLRECGVNEKEVTFNNLNQIAWLVEISA
jgi:SAM-dependent methyltransferase